MFIHGLKKIWSCCFWIAGMQNMYKYFSLYLWPFNLNEFVRIKFGKKLAASGIQLLGH